MASCHHVHLVRLLGIHLSQQISLVSQYMPLGDLLNYIRTNQENVTAKYMMKWSLQIAQVSIIDING